MRLIPSTLALVLALCALPVAQPSTLDGTAWTLSALAGSPALQGRSTLRFEDGHVSGNDGCNSFRGTYEGEGATFRVGALTSSRMACPPPRMAHATRYLEALGKARVTRMDADRLVLADENGAELARFERQPMSLTGGAWEVLGYNNGKQAVVSPIIGTRLTIAFEEGGRVTGEAGCNRFTGSYTTFGTRVTITGVATTRKTCPAEGVMAQEVGYLKALATAARLRMDDERLELRTTEGALAVSARRHGG